MVSHLLLHVDRELHRQCRVPDDSCGSIHMVRVVMLSHFISDLFYFYYIGPIFAVVVRRSPTKLVTHDFQSNSSISDIRSMSTSTSHVRYFTAPSERATLISSRTVMSSYWIVLRYHLGTAACGGLIFAFVEPLR